MFGGANSPVWIEAAYRRLLRKSNVVPGVPEIGYG